MDVLTFVEHFSSAKLAKNAPQMNKVPCCRRRKRAQANVLKINKLVGMFYFRSEKVTKRYVIFSTKR